MKKKYLALTLVAAMCFSLVGCSGMPSLPGGGSKVSSASDVIEKYNEVMEDTLGYHTDMDMEIGISAKAEGMSIDVPIELSLSADVYDKDLHGDIDMSFSFMGMNMDNSAEVYVVTEKKSVTTYTYDSEDGYWTVSEDSTGNAGIAYGGSDLDPDDFEDAEMEYNKDKGLYTITQSFTDFADTNAIYDNIEDLYGSMAEMYDVDADDILDAWEDTDVVYVFDKDFYLVSMTIEGCEYSDVIEEDGVEAEISVTLDMNFEFSDWGEIDEDDVAVPKKVVNSAVPSAEIDIELDDFGGFDDDDAYTYGDDWDHWDYELDDDFVIQVPDDLDPYFTVDVEDDDIDPGMVVEPSGQVDMTTLLGSYNGEKLTARGDSWQDTFGADGWEFDNDDGEFSFMSAVNSKYNGAELYVYNSQIQDTTRSDILNDGIYGYEIDCSYSAKKPNMYWSGLTFGATASQVKSVYGTPSYEYEGTYWNSYMYELSGNVEITFYVYGSDGLQQVSVKNWSYMH